MTSTTIPDTTLSNNVDFHAVLPHDSALPQEPASQRFSTPDPHSGPRPEHYQRIVLNGTETTAELRARGLSSMRVKNYTCQLMPAL